MMVENERNTYRGLGRISSMAYGFEYFSHSYRLSGYTICMILESLWFYVFLFIAGAIWLYLTE